MCVVCEECEIMWIFFFLIFRLTCIFVGLTDFVKRGVLTLVDEISRYRNYHYYYYYYCCCYYYYLFLTGPFTNIFLFKSLLYWSHRPSTFAERCIPSQRRVGSWRVEVLGGLRPVESDIPFWSGLPLNGWFGRSGLTIRLVVLCLYFD